MVIVHDCIYSCSIFVEAVFVRGGLAGCFRRFGRLSDGCLMFDGISLWGGFGFGGNAKISMYSDCIIIRFYIGFWAEKFYWLFRILVICILNFVKN